jgi:cysteinyl-tRNA synthetase
MRHHRDVPSTRPHHPSLSSGVVGAEGRYPLHEQAALPLRIAGATVLPVGPLRMYTCGITPYDVTHVGHASTFVWADMVAALAHATGTDSLVARNVTDVDDVLTYAAWQRGRNYDELALSQEFLFDRDMKALGVAPPTMAPHARVHVAAAVRLASALLDADAAYEVDGFVYFRGAGVPAAAGIDANRALALSRDYGDQAAAPHRESVFDVAVWRPSADEHPAWPSPWGWGRPGWHAECAAMAVASLGSSVDVVLGGSDLTFPHHAYQAAMVEAATGVHPFAQAVIHVGEVRRDGEKMAKSTGNLVLVSDLLERHSPAALRLALLNRRYDEPWDCEEPVFTAAGDLVEQLQAIAGDRQQPSVRHDGVLTTLTQELDVPGAVSLAMSEGQEAARYLLDVLKLRNL